MRQVIFATIIAGLFAGCQAQCKVNGGFKIDCGFFGITEGECLSKGCCWDEVPDSPFCYQPGNEPNLCAAVKFEADDPGFTTEDRLNLYDGLLENINVDGLGGVVASRDSDTPGGSYFFHWMRDAALTIKDLLDINDNDISRVRPFVESYVEFVGRAQSQPALNGIDVRVEPKFLLPFGDIFTGPWCRPQNDGPALRAMALIKIGEARLAAGEDASDLWGKITFDLDWVVAFWANNGCDLWEEIRSDDFYWNRAGYVYSLNLAADFAAKIGEDGSRYRAKAQEILAATVTHYDSAAGYIYSDLGQKIDSSVLHAVATFGESTFGPDSPEAIQTLAYQIGSFCFEYEVNQQDIRDGIPGMLIGRYPGDFYAGGNPWPLLTAVTAEVFYLGAKANYQKVLDGGSDDVIDRERYDPLFFLLNLRPDTTYSQLASAQIKAGDAILQRLRYHVRGADDRVTRVSEQVDKNTGFPVAAEGLTWSHANILHALSVRDQVIELQASVKV